MTTTIENNGIRDVVVLHSDEGKVLRRKSDGELFGNELWLGKTWYLHGERLTEPIDEVPEDYDEIDEPNEEVAE